MATYVEIRKLFNEGELRNKVEVACVVAAEAILVEDGGTANHANRLVWMKAVFTNPRATAEILLMVLLAANKSLDVGDANTPGTILGVTDTQIQSQVNTAIDTFADGS